MLQLAAIFAISPVAVAFGLNDGIPGVVLAASIAALGLTITTTFTHIGRAGVHRAQLLCWKMTNSPVALEAYEVLAESYAAMIDTKPHNAYYERPATLSLLPDVAGLQVLDAGCGPGVYAEWLANRGAKVLALDVSPKMVELASQRLGGRAQVHVADLGHPLTFLENDSFDLVLSTLVLEYIEDWRATASEFYRVVRPGGQLVVSVTHPLADFTFFKSEFYFQTESVRTEWRGFEPVRVQVPTFRRSLEETLNPFLEAGFRLERILEPKPTEEFREADRRHYDELMRQPCFLCIRASK